MASCVDEEQQHTSFLHHDDSDEYVSVEKPLGETEIISYEHEKNNEGASSMEDESDTQSQKEKEEQERRLAQEEKLAQDQKMVI